MENVNQKFEENISMENIAKDALDFIEPNKIIQGEVVTIDNDFAYINVGIKSDGRVSLEEFKLKPEVGELIEVMLVNKRMIDGMLIFSKVAAANEKAWKRFMETHKEGNLITGRIAGSNSKGITIDCDGLHAFLPFSLSGDIRVKSASVNGNEYTFKIKSVDEKRRAVLLSRKEYLDAEKEKIWNNIINNYKPGDKIKGKAVKFVEFGTFVDVGGIEGLLHKNDTSWKKMFKKKNILKIGEEREFVILDIKKDEGKISLGLKQLVPDPWVEFNNKHHLGDTVSGKIVAITAQGSFVEIEDGVEGYLGSSDVSWTKKNVVMKDMYAKGDNVTVQIIGINNEDKKLSLGIKQLMQNPWDTIKDRLPVGSVIKRKIKKIVSFGLFVELEDDIDGLIHISDISWDENIKDLTTMFKVNDEIEFKILEIKKDEMKISCGIKQLIKSPWEIIKEKYPPRSKVSGVISSIANFGIFVKLSDDIEGLVHISEVSRRKIENIEEVYKIGDTVAAVVLGVDIARKRISLSMKLHEVSMEKEELNKILKSTSSNKVTIGDLMKMRQGE